MFKSRVPRTSERDRRSEAESAIPKSSFIKRPGVASGLTHEPGSLETPENQKQHGVFWGGLTQALLKRGDTERLTRGNISVLKNRGLLVGSATSDIGLDFEVHRFDSTTEMTAARPFTAADLGETGDLAGAISTFNGGQVTSNESGTGSVGLYWTQHKLSESVGIINVVNGMSGTVGIKIPLKNIQIDRPILITSGALSGCTMIYAVDGEYFYAYHTGQKPGHGSWKTGKDGVGTTYQSHLALKGTSVDGMENHNDSLMSMLECYDDSMLTYLGKEGTKLSDRKVGNAFDYNSARAKPFDIRTGYSYALLQRDSHGLNVKAYSEDAVVDPIDNSVRVISSMKRRLI